MEEEENIEKKDSQDVSTSRIPLGPTGFNGLKTVSGYIYEELKKDLQFPKAAKTYAQMSYDPTIRAANNLLDMTIGRVDWQFKAPEGASEEGQRAAEFLNWCKENMDELDWKEFVNEVGSYRIYGYHIAEKVYTQVKSGKWKGKLKWSDLPARAQSSVHKWNFDSEGRKLVGVEQLPPINWMKPVNNIPAVIPRNKFMLFRYDVKNNNPEGTSPLKGCYVPWKYKTIIEEYEAVGVSKDLGGTPILGIDAEYLAKAQSDPGSNEAAVVKRLQTDAANLHAGEQTYIIKPIAYNGEGKEMFSFDLIGIDGGY